MLLIQIFFGWSQQLASVSGKIIDAKTQKPIANVVVSIENTNLTKLSNSEGFFSIENAAVGNQILKILSVDYETQLLSIEIVKYEKLDIGTIALEDDNEVEQQMALVTLTENDLGDDNSGSENTSGLLQASRDAFQQSAAFNWGQARFRMRGLDNEYGNILINGISVNKIIDGRPQFGNWGGLNDATRNQEFTNGSAPNDYVFGGILGIQEINTRASLYRKGTRLSFASTNTNYAFRAMGTHVSGMSKNGWAYVVSAGRRWAQEAYFEGTDYSANSFFTSIEKRINDNHTLNFTAIYAQNRRGRNSPNTNEVMNLVGNKYNSLWGYQEGRKRNSRDRNLEEPIFMLEHFWKVTSRTKINTTVMYQKGQIGNSRLDFQGVDNPDPTYYRKLPSYFTSLFNETTNAFEGNSPTNIALANGASEKFVANPQIKWDFLINQNRSTAAENSVVVLYEDRTDDKMWVANSVLTTQISDNILMHAGGSLKKLESANFQNLQDLLGGKFYRDIDPFGQNANQQQADLNNPNRNVVVGDKYGYHYNMFANVADVFTQFKFNYNKIDFYLAQNYSRSEYQREGLYKNGYYTTTSFGKSDNKVFDNFGFKGGATYKFSGRAFLSANAFYQTKAPSMRNIFPNARVSNNSTLNITNENITSGDLSYIINMPSFKGRLTGYFSKVKNATRTTFFFADGVGIDDGDPTTNDDGGDFLAETITGLDRRNIGAELGLEFQITPTIKATATAAYGEFTFDNNPNASYTQDSQASVNKPNPIINLGSSNMKGYRQGGTPQQAASVGIEYRDPKYWFVGANLNYLAANYIDIAPILRTANFFKNFGENGNGNPFTETTAARARELLTQERLPDFMLLNMTGGKSWRVKGSTIGFFATINNLLNLQYKTGGFEQARNASFRELNNDVVSGTPPFASRYFMGFGRTYFINLYINF
ncbi:MAG: hypothetical protein RLZZ312_944 [Bacteroidota bacterium]